ncbi:MAG: NADH-quinone oxidoreductase subunit H, partial [Dehalococcoidales bacterium]
LLFLIKVFAVFFFIMWVRSTLPRLRIDQVMAFAWKFLLPLALINLIVTSLQVILGWPEASPWLMVFLNLAIMAVLVILWSRLFKTGGGRVEV